MDGVGRHALGGVTLGRAHGRAIADKVVGILMARGGIIVRRHPVVVTVVVRLGKPGGVELRPGVEVPFATWQVS